MDTLALGTKEEVLVNVADKLGNLTTLDGLVLTFDVIGRDGVARYTGQPATNSLMVGKCLVDTAGWTRQEYLLYFMVQTATEKPRLGPYRFNVA